MFPSIDFIPRTPFSGIQSEWEAADWVLFGFPFDLKPSYRTGSHLAPPVIREASVNIEACSYFSNRDTFSILLHDLGDISFSPEDDPLKAIRIGQEVVSKIVNEGKKPIVLGGNHCTLLTTLPAIKKAGLIIFDAHLDLRSDYLENPLSHACVVRRIIEEGVSIENILFVGNRALSSEEIEFLKENSIRTLPARDIHTQTLRESTSQITDFVNGFKEVYISFDMDVYDPAYSPGVGTPEPMGLSPFQVFSLFQGIKNPLAGIDLSELCVPFDPSGITAILASRTIFELLLRK